MVWYQLHIENCANDTVEQLSDALETLGAVSVMLTDKNDDPILEPAPGSTPLWPEVVIDALFTEEAQSHRVQQELEHEYPHLLCTVSVLGDKDWVKASMENFQPQQFGKKLWVCPTWSIPPEKNAVNLFLDPGLAFGTGTHPTTALCLDWLALHDLADKKVIDYGCGSGILALAALKLGAAKVQAVDIDPQALQATENNAALNHIHRESLSLDLPEHLEDNQDLILANILLTPLLELGQRFYALLKPNADLVVSGLLETQTACLIDHYRALFKHMDTKISGDWALVQFQRL